MQTLVTHKTSGRLYSTKILISSILKIWRLDYIKTFSFPDDLYGSKSDFSSKVEKWDIRLIVEPKKNINEKLYE